MSRKFTPKVLTGNRLLQGDVVWMASDGTWTERMAAARLFLEAEDAQAALDQAEKNQQDQIVGAYLADASPGGAGPEPTHFREAFRRRGPSNYAHGKQAEGTHV
ncbi:MAG: DUF2849 domain-containing protein [Pseudomonadota bacterium]